MTVLAVVQLLFLLIALLLVVNAFWPGWNFNVGPTFAVRALIVLLIELVVLYIAYLIVLAIFGLGTGLALR